MSFALTEDQYNRILGRLTKIEQTVNDIMVAINHFITRTDITQIQVIFETDIQDLKESVASLEDRVEEIEQEPLT